MHFSVNKHIDHNCRPAVKRRAPNINANPFDLLYNEPECYICHDFGHKAIDCNLKKIKTDPIMKHTAEPKVWRKKERPHYNLVLSVHEQKDLLNHNINRDQSKHMSGDNERSENATVENKEIHEVNSQRNADEQCTKNIDKHEGKQVQESRKEDSGSEDEEEVLQQQFVKYCSRMIHTHQSKNDTIDEHNKGPQTRKKIYHDRRQTHLTSFLL